MNDNYDEHTITDAEQIDYEEIENAFYNALVEFNESQEADSVSSNSLNSDVLEFASSTDSKLYTVRSDAPLTSIEEQQTAYLLDVRNILLIFLFSYFLLTVYFKLKVMIKKYYTEE